VERHRPPAKCPHCGTAGVIFVRADPDDGGEQPESFREAWLRAGLEVAGAPALR